MHLLWIISIPLLSRLLSIPAIRHEELHVMLGRKRVQEW